MMFLIAGCIFSFFSSDSVKPLEKAQVAYQENNLQVAHQEIIAAELANAKEKQVIDKIKNEIEAKLFTKKNPSSYFISDKKPTKLLEQILLLDNLYEKDDTLFQIVEKTQKKWIRVQSGKNNIEFRNLIDSQDESRQKQTLQTLLEKTAFFQEQVPFLNHYDYFFCPGAFLPTARARMEEALKLYQSGITFSTLVFLTGERALKKEPGEPDSPENLLQPLTKDTLYETEYDMMRVLWDSLDKENKVPNVIFINATRRPGNARISMKDSLEAFKKEFGKKPGSVLLIHSPFYWTYQLLTTQNILGNAFKVDVRAPSPSKMPEVSVLHDVFAKILFESQFQYDDDSLSITS